MESAARPWRSRSGPIGLVSPVGVMNMSPRPRRPANVHDRDGRPGRERFSALSRSAPSMRRVLQAACRRFGRSSPCTSLDRRTELIGARRLATGPDRGSSAAGGADRLAATRGLLHPPWPNQTLEQLGDVVVAVEILGDDALAERPSPRFAIRVNGFDGDSRHLTLPFEGRSDGCGEHPGTESGSSSAGAGPAVRPKLPVEGIGHLPQSQVIQSRLRTDRLPT